MTGRAAGHRGRRGFTLWELVVVMVVLAVTLGVSIPAYVQFGANKAATPIDELLAVLNGARAASVRYEAAVLVAIDPKSGAYRVDTLAPTGAGTLRADTFSIDLRRAFAVDSARLRFMFRPTGAAFGDTIRVRDGSGDRLVVVDAWNGIARADAR